VGRHRARRARAEVATVRLVLSRRGRWSAGRQPAHSGHLRHHCECSQEGIYSGRAGGIIAALFWSHSKIYLLLNVEDPAHCAIHTPKSSKDVKSHARACVHYLPIWQATTNPSTLMRSLSTT